MSFSHSLWGSRFALMKCKPWTFLGTSDLRCRSQLKISCSVMKIFRGWSSKHNVMMPWSSNISIDLSWIHFPKKNFLSFFSKSKFGGTPNNPEFILKFLGIIESYWPKNLRWPFSNNVALPSRNLFIFCTFSNKTKSLSMKSSCLLISNLGGTNFHTSLIGVAKEKLNWFWSTSLTSVGSLDISTLLWHTTHSGS